MSIQIGRREFLAGATGVALGAAATSFFDLPRSKPDLTLHVSDNIRPLHYFGEFAIELQKRSWFEFNSRHGNITNPNLNEVRDDTLNRNTLYRAASSAEVFYFRYGADNFDASSNKTGFWGVTWGNNRVAPPGTYSISSVRDLQLIEKPFELCTVGDSLTHFSEGEKFRACLAMYMPDYSFVGSKTDVYGYGHDGNGGDSTIDILSRAATIFESDSYLLWAGSNDRFQEPAWTVENLQKISTMLQAKQKKATIFIGTILPTTQEFDARSISTNNLIRSWLQNSAPNSLHLVEIERQFRSIRNWQSLLWDGLHPKQSGYEALAKIIAPQIKA